MAGIRRNVFAIGLLYLLSGAQAHLNIFLNLHEVLRLIGVSAELYYVREGAINDYALNFAVPVPANISDVTFTWQSLVEHPLPYSINIATSDTDVLPRPLLNISRIGDVPQEPQTWGIALKCSGTRNAEVTVTINVEVILDRTTNNNTNLIFKRKKICLKEEQDSAHEEYDDDDVLQPALGGHEDVQYVDHNEEHVVANGHLAPSVDHDKLKHRNVVTEPSLNVGRGNGNGNGNAGGSKRDFDPMLRENLVPPASGLVTLIVGGILALVLVSTLILIAYCAKGPSKRHPSNGVHLIKTSSFQRLPTISSTAHNSIYVCPSTITPTYATLTRPFREYEHEPEEFNRRLQELTVQKCRVRLSCLVQEGNFGRIYRGTYNDCQEVLVKTVAQHASQLQVNLLLQESMMLYEAIHPNVLSVLGISIEDYATPFVLYAATGSVRNLKTFLQDPSYARSVTTIQTVLMASQLAMAMEHLHNHGVIHKDIAARNCVIDDQLRVKLTDSALSRDLFSGDYNCLGDGEYRPIKWLSLEALQKSHYNEGSDVWSFGVLMWEMCTLGKLPYAEIDPYEMEHYLKDGYRLAQPFNCPDELFTIMAYCWASMPAERPSFSQLQICLSEFHTQITRYV
ncbi:tyrosine-protein kinase Drl [Drosophila pseudoobscura]|uniref:receptor protein-tyrosine kinase n=1 Tax=Drosophila pseudoobscura pseudoobscura TaxID=46245 RepID=A0A6I8UJ04_DROPS|nr:tyrosine-protein kinase Drl [Drosophila pseudoobscura]